MRVSGKTTLVTGASSGLGKRMAERFAQAGANLVVLGRDAAKLEETASLCRSAGARVLAITGEIGEEAQVDNAVTQAEASFGQVDIVLNCAGISMSTRQNLEDIDPELWDRMIETNVRGTYLTSRRVLPGMKARGNGAIVNIGSTGSHIARPGVSLYAASKFAVRALTDSLIEECNGSGVRICLVSAGPINTPFWESFNGTPPMDREQMLQPDDLADAALWLIERPANVRVDEILLRPFNPTPQTARGKEQ